MFVQAWFLPDEVSHLGLLILSAVLPVFLAGFAEDVTNAVPPRFRLLASFIAGVGFCGLTGVWVTDVELSAANYFLSISAVGIGFTVLAIAALSNAFNIIDGLNGLSIGTAFFMSLTIGILAVHGNDATMMALATCLSASFLGVLLFNFPFGKIFVGDGGAYFMGAMIAAMAVLLPERNDAVSPYASAIIVIYPFYELMRSFLRRLVGNGAAPMQPDNKHLHSMVFRFVRQHCPVKGVLQNSLASCAVLILPLMNCIWALNYFDDRDKLIIGLLGFIVVYEAAMRVLRNKLR
jgi:UDP-N-acetylmuramyl pentapeptide phosphotransferase/UDP-N-acetylglucosamine-1-phosphate transferase